MLPSDYRYITTVTGLENYASAVLPHITEKTSSGESIKIGLDTEFDSEGLRLISVSIEGYTPSCLIHPFDWGTAFASTMKKILELDCALIIGCNVAGDIHLLRKTFGIRIKRVRDNRRYCLHDDSSQKTGLDDMAARYCGVYVDTSLQTASFNVRPPLALPLQIYAMGDAIISLRIDNAISKKLASADTTTASTQHPPDLQPGTEVILKIGRRDAAIAELVLLGECGGNNNRESHMWGSLYVGAKKALVRIVTILVPAAKVPFQHENWGPGRLTLADIFANQPCGTIAVHSKQIRKRFGNGDRQVSNTTTTQVSNTTTTDVEEDGNRRPAVEVEENEQEKAASTVHPDSAPTPTAESTIEDAEVEVEDTMVEDDVVEDDVIRSRAKSDIWHEFHNTPLHKDDAASPAIFALLRVATHTINQIEEEKVKHVLRSKGVTDFYEHFFFNKEWWYKRVQMPPRKGSVASNNLLTVLDYLQSNEVFKEYVSDELVKHIKGWAKRCLQGRYDDLPDVEMYKHEAYDQDGLELWLRHRGSKAENFHQKMHVAVGPYGIGVQTAHYLQVILAYSYLVNARVRRCDEPDFGHSMLHLEDRIQSRISEIWDTNLFPNRTNVSEFSPLDFTSVGIAPLSFDEAYVQKGEPDDSLTGGLRFLAKRQGVKFPPLPPSSKAELGIIRKFCSDHPQPTTVVIKELCNRFNALSDAKNGIFPKLPTMINPSIKRFKINQQHELVRLQTKSSFDEIFEKFRSDKVSLLPPPENPSKRKRARNSSTNQIREEATNGDGPQPMQRIFIQPLTAPGQTQSIPLTSAAASNRCVFWPICMKNVGECGGNTLQSCNVYGTNGTKATPTKTELESAIRQHSYVGRGRTRNCYWYPFCGKAIECGGMDKLRCSKYGAGGTNVNERPSDEELRTRKRQIKTQKQKERRQQNEMN